MATLESTFKKGYRIPFHKSKYSIKNEISHSIFGQKVIAIQMEDFNGPPVIYNDSMLPLFSEDHYIHHHNTFLYSSKGYDINEPVYVPRYHKFLWATPAGIMSAICHHEGQCSWWRAKTDTGGMVDENIWLTGSDEVMTLKGFVDRGNMTFYHQYEQYSLQLEPNGVVRVTNNSGKVIDVPAEVFFELKT